MKDVYKAAINEAIDNCTDMGLLDLVWKMLTDEATCSPDPVPSITMEVKTYANNPRNSRSHGAVTGQVWKSVKHPAPNRAGLGNRREKLPGVCGGADSIQSAA